MQIRRLAPSGLAWDGKLFVLGAAVISLMHSVVMVLFGWPQVPGGIAAAVSIVHGVQWRLGRAHPVARRTGNPGMSI